MTKVITKHFTNDFIEYFEGDLPLIISSCHGGKEKPSYIKTRTKGVFEKDTNTYELSKQIIKEFKKQTGKSPYAVLTTIAREKVDLNRDVNEAYESQGARRIYEEFHFLIKSARKKVETKHQRGIYFDIHGQSHTHCCIEFGYLLDNETLKLNDKELNTHQKYSSIKTLSKFSDKPFIQQLKGDNSLGTLMTEYGYDSIPSNTYPYSKNNEYFEGAYNTLKYGSLDDGNISAIQVEFPFIKCRDNEENIKKTAKAFVKASLSFLEIHLQ